VSKKYYWLKLQTDFFDDLTIKMIEEMDNGVLYTNFLMKLYLKSVKTEGKLLFRNALPYDEKMLSILTGVNIDTVRSALKIFLKFGMVERWDDGTLYISEVQKMIGNETDSAKRVRKHREEKKLLLQCNADETKSNTEKELEKEIELKLEKKKEKDIRHKYGEYKNVLLTDKQFEKLSKDFSNIKDLIKLVDEGIQMKGYKYKDFNLVIRTWAKNNKGSNNSSYTPQNQRQAQVSNQYEEPTHEQESLMI